MIMEYLERNYLPENFYGIPELTNYCALGKVRNFKKGDPIILPGQSLEKLLLIIDGRVKVSRLSPNGKEHFQYFAENYAVINELFPSEDSPLQIIAVKNTKTCMFTREQLLQIISKDHTIALEILKALSQKSNYFEERLVERTYDTATTRICRLINNLVLQSGVYGDDGYYIDIPLPQNYISQITGLHFITVCNVIKKLKNDRILGKDGKKLIVYDLEKLNKYLMLCENDF